MIIKKIDGKWIDEDGSSFEDILKTYGVELQEVEKYIESREFLIRSKFNSILKIEMSGNGELRFTPFFSERDDSLKFIYINKGIRALSDKAEIYIDKSTNFLNLKKLKAESLDYYIEMRNDGMAILGLINKVDSREFRSYDDFLKDLDELEAEVEINPLKSPNYLTVIKCYDDLSLLKLKNILKDYRLASDGSLVYLTGLYEFTVLSKYAINNLITRDLIASSRTSPLSEFNKREVRDVRKRLFSEIENNVREEEENIIRGYFSALYHKTDETVEHSERLNKIVTYIGQELMIKDEEFETLTKMGMIHDIGKLAIEAKIINKPGKLDDIEFDMIKKHTILGYEMMDGLESYTKAKQVCLLHHERWDGAGYPTGKLREEIPLLVRIVSVADSIDAMVSRRVYKDPYGLDYVRSEIEKNQGLQFCPQVSKTCLDIFDKISKIYK